MNIALFCHSLISDWNHGNAHFLRGMATELIERGHQVNVYEPRSAWSRENLVRDYGTGPLTEFNSFYPRLSSIRYDLGTLDIDRVLAGIDLVLVHEWNDRELVRRIGEYRRRSPGCRILFHDTHHRAATSPHEMERYDLSRYDGVLAFGECIRDLYLERGWIKQAWVLHEAADTRIFHPIRKNRKSGDLVWIGNWGDEERTAEYEEFLIEPAAELGLRTAMYGVRYPAEAVRRLARAGIEYRGWTPNFRVPQIFADFRVTVHIPRRPYAEALPGIPTIRPFEAMACGIPLISTPWHDTGNLFEAGVDFLVAQNGREMKAHLRRIVTDPGFASDMAGHALRTILARHTCAHRVDELLSICRELNLNVETVGPEIPARAAQ